MHNEPSALPVTYEDYRIAAIAALMAFLESSTWTRDRPLVVELLIGLMALCEHDGYPFQKHLDAALSAFEET